MKNIRRVLFCILFVFIFILAGCSKKAKEKYNENISDLELGAVIYDLSHSFDEKVIFEEQTFITDPNDTDYEIGYAYQTGEKLTVRRDRFYQGEEFDEYANFSLTNYCIGFHKVRRNKTTKKVDENFFAPVIETDEIESYDIWVDFNHFSDKPSDVYKITYARVDEITELENKVKIGKKETFELIPYNVWVLPLKQMKIESNGDDKDYFYKYNGSDWIKVEEGRLDIAAKFDFVSVDRDGNEMFFITITTAVKLAKK